MRLGRVVYAFFGLLMAGPIEAREFRSSDIYPADYPTVQAVVQMDRLIRQRSEGRHGITMLGRIERERSADYLAQLREGRLDMARIQLGALDPQSPVAVVPSLPFLFKSTAHLRQVLDGPVGEELLASLEVQGLVGLCFYDAGPRSFYSVKQPIRTVADLKGLKVRVQQTDIWSTLMRALGAEPQRAPLEHVFADLQSGDIDAADANWPTYVATRHYNVAKHFSPTEHAMAPAVLVFAKRAWDELTREDQALLRTAARDSLVHMRRLADEYETAARRTVQTAGGEIATDVDRKSFADALLPLYATVLTDARMRSMVRSIQDGP